MRRRRVIEAVSVAALGLAGCTSGPRKDGQKWGPPETEPATPTEDLSSLTPTTEPGFGLSTDFTYSTTTGTESFAVTVTVRNTADVRRRAVLVVTWDRGDESQQEVRSVNLAPAERVTFEMTFPETGNLSFDWREP